MCHEKEKIAFDGNYKPEQEEVLVIEKYNIGVIPLHVNFDNESYEDGVQITLEQLYKKVEEKGVLPTTSAASHGEVETVFKK